MRFCTAVNCMDGRVQLPVIRYLLGRFDAQYVDTVTEPGPNAILARRADARTVEAIERRLRISIERHGSLGIAVVGHHDCAGNPAGADQQTQDTLEAVRYIERRFPGIPVIGLWVSEAWKVSEIGKDAAAP